jgi:hypothetical protein
MAGISYLKKAGQWLKRCHVHDWEHVNQSNAVQINSLTQDNRQITVREPAKIVEVNFSTVSTQWFSSPLYNEQKDRQVQYQLRSWAILKRKVSHFCIQ